MRIDQLLVLRGLATTRSQAQRLIADGVEWLQGEAWKRVAKNGDEVPENADVRLLDDSEARYVSRGGLKLEAALKQVGLSVDGLACLDVGQSTGGFTDCLLQHGARLVAGVDVGSAQLHPQLREDGRVLCVEKVNARSLVATDFEAACVNYTGAGGQFDPEADGAEPFVPEFDVVVGDLSFISQTLVWPALVPLLKPGGHVLMLVKPQFELQPEHIGKGGLVKSEASYPLVRERIEQVVKDSGLALLDYFESPITGGDGNREFLVFARLPA